MQNTKVEFKETGLFSSLFCEYIQGSEELKPFYNSTIDHVDLGQFNISEEIRSDLVEVIAGQAQLVSLSSTSTYNLNQLKEQNTYTVTTGHQLNICLLYTSPSPRDA